MDASIRSALRGLVLVAGFGTLTSRPALTQPIGGDSVAVRFVQADLVLVLQALGRHLPKPLMVNVPGAGQRVTLDYPTPVPRVAIPAMLRGIAESYALELREDSTFYVVSQKPAALPGIVSPASVVTAADSIQLFIIRLKHARAADVAATVNQLFGGAGEFGPAGLSTGTLSDELRRNRVPPGLVEASPTPKPRPEGASLAGPLALVADQLTNSLLLRTTQRDHQLIRNVVQELDVRPLQVLIEVLIVEARQDRDFTLGGSLDYKREDGSTTYEGAVGAPLVGDIVVKVMRLGRTELQGLLSAAQSKGAVDIVSRPVILASNNTESYLLVGAQRPFVQVSRTLPTDSPLRDQVVQYRDVGTKLIVKPTINQDGYVSLLIQQEISAATEENQFGAPVISTREAKTQLLVKDGQTIVMGGLRDHQSDRLQSGVPILSGIPIIGGLFGKSTRKSSRTELYLFLTPRIIRSDADADSLTATRMPKVEDR